jgi:Ca2+-binding EF-hand superfamily protein
MNDHKKQVQTSTLSLQRYLEVGKKARELFHVLDSDGDGKIQAKELVQVIGENHAGRMLSAIDGILENKEANGFIEPVEFQHYFEYIIARDGYDASIEGIFSKFTHFFF